jgi:CheY-like chemotaxis protein
VLCAGASRRHSTPLSLAWTRWLPDRSVYGQLERHEGVVIDSDALVFVDAVALVQQLRHEHSDASVFVVSRYLDLAQRLCLFEAGVDDCVHEPFLASELAVRLSLSIRLRQAAADMVSSDTVNVLRAGDLELDLVRRRVARRGKPIDLRPREFLLLEYLVGTLHPEGVRVYFRMSEETGLIAVDSKINGLEAVKISIRARNQRSIQL